MWILTLVIVIVVVVVVCKRAKNRDAGESKLAAIVEAADSGDPSAKQELMQYLDNCLTDEKCNEIRRKIYGPKALSGDANAQYWLGLLATNERESLEWMTKAAEGGNTNAMGWFYHSGDIGEENGKARYWLVKAAESDPSAMVLLGLQYDMEDRPEEALALYTRAANVGGGETKVKAYTNIAGIYGNVLSEGYDPEKQKAYLLKALSVRPAPADNSFNDTYAQAARRLMAWFENQNISSPSESNVKNAAYCAVIAAALDRDYADALNKYTISRSDFDVWVIDARNHNFHLPC